MEGTQQLDVLREELARARGAHQRYEMALHKFSLLLFVVLVVLVGGALVWDRVLILLVPFVLIYGAANMAHLVSFLVLARIHAQGLEQAINRALGAEVAVLHRLETTYLFPVGRPRLVGLIFDDLANSLSGMTWHYLIAGTLLFVFSIFYGFPVVSKYIDELSWLWALYYVVLVLWLLANLAYVVWTQLGQQAERNAIEELRRAYDVPVTLDGSGA